MSASKHFMLTDANKITTCIKLKPGDLEGTKDIVFLPPVTI